MQNKMYSILKRNLYHQIDKKYFLTKIFLTTFCFNQIFRTKFMFKPLIML